MKYEMMSAKLKSDSQDRSKVIIFSPFFCNAILSDVQECQIIGPKGSTCFVRNIQTFIYVQSEIFYFSKVLLCYGRKSLSKIVFIIRKFSRNTNLMILTD